MNVATRHERLASNFMQELSCTAFPCHVPGQTANLHGIVALLLSRAKACNTSLITHCFLIIVYQFSLVELCNN